MTVSKSQWAVTAAAGLVGLVSAGIAGFADAKGLPGSQRSWLIGSLSSGYVAANMVWLDKTLDVYYSQKATFAKAAREGAFDAWKASHVLVVGSALSYSAGYLLGKHTG